MFSDAEFNHDLGKIGQGFSARPESNAIKLFWE